MAKDDLRTLVSKTYQYTLSSLQMALKSDGSKKKCWILVEGKADYDCYRKVFKGKDALVAQAGYVNKLGEIKGGNGIVKEIVQVILNDGVTNGIIGIVDADYTSFMQPPRSCPSHIFQTDKRDLEMTLWSIPEISSAMISKLSTEPTQPNRKLSEEKLDKCKEICSYMGSIHISHAWHGYVGRYEFLNSLYWDMKTHVFKTDWKCNIFQSYQKGRADLGVVYTQENLDESNLKCDVEYLDFCTISRGHDFLSVLSNAMIATAIYTEASLIQSMISYCSIENFSTTNLWHSIEQWQNANGYEVAILS